MNAFEGKRVSLKGDTQSRPHRWEVLACGYDQETKSFRLLIEVFGMTDLIWSDDIEDIHDVGAD